MKRTVLVLMTLLYGSIAAHAQLYKDPSASIEDRVEDLLSRMTLQEKIDQISMTGLRNYPREKSNYGVCDITITDIGTITGEAVAAKKHAFSGTRLGIPPIVVCECLHGLLASGTTIFPQAISQGSTWNPDLIRSMAEAIAEEASAAGMDQALSPLFDLIREPRYGRNEECYSEDPLLAGTIGSAFVTGLQGPKEETLKGIPEGKIMCTAKHFAGYSQPLGGINTGPASLGERELRSLQLVPFEMAVKDANIYSVMPSYNEIDGIPAHANRWLLTEVLRNEWKFKGYTFSDYGGIYKISSFHKTAKDYDEAGIMALKAGMDLEAARPRCYLNLARSVSEGLIDEAVIDEAVRRILAVKFRAGLFEKPLADPEKLAGSVHTPEHIALARKVADESMVLLQNEGSLLPLDRKKIRSIAVIGPNADQVQYGDYSCTRDNSTGITILQGIKAAAGKKVKVRYAKGCSICGLSKDGFGEAVEAARQSDAVVCVLGGTSVVFSTLGWGKGLGQNEPDDPFTCGEAYDLTDINPPGVQRELLQALKETGKPIVLVLVHGRPWTIDWEKKNIPAILEAWYPGEQGGASVAGILFGDVNPSGRLCCGFPQSTGHLPAWYDHKPSAKGINLEPGTPEKPGRDYVFSSPDPLYAFGHGLSYTSFEYSGMTLSSSSFGQEGLDIKVKVTNTGNRDGKEVVQLYVNDLISSVTTPVMQLKGFKKISLKKGQSETVTFHVSPEDLALWNAEMKKVTEPGDFEFMIGRSSADVVCRQTAAYTGR